jgi:hypothetical protein
MGDEENSIGLELHGVEGGKPGFSKAGREDDEAGEVPLGTRSNESFERFPLDRVRHRDRPGRFGGDVYGQRDPLRPAFAISLDPVGVERTGSWVVEEAFEVSRDCFESRAKHDLIVPLDSVHEGRLAQIRASDVGNGSGSVEEIGLGMKARGARHEDAGVEKAFGSLLEVEEAEKGVGLRDLEIVARQDPDAAAALEEVFEVSLEKGDAAFEDEGRKEVSALRLVQVAPEVGEKRVAFAGDERRTEGRRDGPIEDAVRELSRNDGLRQQTDMKMRSVMDLEVVGSGAEHSVSSREARENLFLLLGCHLEPGGDVSPGDEKSAAAVCG